MTDNRLPPVSRSEPAPAKPGGGDDDAEPLAGWASAHHASRAMRHFAPLKLEARVDPKPDPNLSPAASGHFMGLDRQVVGLPVSTWAKMS